MLNLSAPLAFLVIPGCCDSLDSLIEEPLPWGWSSDRTISDCCHWLENHWFSMDGRKDAPWLLCGGRNDDDAKATDTWCWCVRRKFLM